MPESLELVLTFAIVAATVVLFVLGRLRSDAVAVLSLLALFVAGVLSTSQALAGFADPTTVMIAGLFVVGEGLSRTGITARLGELLMERAGDSELRLLVVLSVGAAGLSAFMSNTGTVAMLMPAVAATAWRIGSAPSRFLIPLAFAANVGGLITLIGSPPNIVVADALASAGYTRLGFFDFALLGLPLTALVVAYMALVGRRVLPVRRAGARPIDLDGAIDAIAESHHLGNKLFRLRVPDACPLIGRTLAEAAFERDFGVSVLVVEHAGGRERPWDELRSRAVLPGPDTTIALRDVLVVKGNPEAVARLATAWVLELVPVDPEKEDLAELLLTHDVGVAEVVVAPRSDYGGLTLAESRIAEKFEVQVITLRRGERVLPRKETALTFGDVLLVRGRWSAIERLRAETHNFVVVGEPDALSKQVVQLSARSYVAAVTVLAMIALMVFSVVPTVIAVLLAATAMILTGCLSIESAYRSIQWQTVVLVAATLPLSTALQTTGGAALLADTLVGTLGALGPRVLMAGVFLLTAGLSQVMSNTATAVLVAPIVVSAARTLGIHPAALLVTVAAGTASAFLTPIASPTNTLVLEAGGYTWGDYAKIGLPLLVLVLAVSLVIVPLAWPLT
ncbi:MAG: SLC13 family permease [Sandaracinaceae bacterium]